MTTGCGPVEGSNGDHAERDTVPLDLGLICSRGCRRVPCEHTIDLLRLLNPGRVIPEPGTDSS